MQPNWRNLRWVLPIVIVMTLAACASAPPATTAPTPQQAEPEPTTESTAEPAWQPQLSLSLEHDEIVQSLAFSPDGTTIAAGIFPEIHVWDIGQAALLHRIEQVHSVDDLDFSPDGQWLAAGMTTNGVVLNNAQDGEEMLHLHRGNDNRVVFAPDGQTIATGNREGAVWIWDAATGEMLAELVAPEADYLTALAYSSDGGLLAAGYFDCLVHLWNVSEGRLVRSFEREGSSCAASGLAFSPDDSLLAGAGARVEFKPVATVWRVADGTLVENLPAPSETYDVAFSPDGEWLAVGSQDGVSLWQLPQFFLEFNLDQGFDSEEHDRVTSLAFSPDGRLMAAGRWNGQLDLWQVRSE